MPYTLTIPLAGCGDPPRDIYRVLHANLLGWIAAVDADLGAEVHDRPARKPFTLSGLRPDGEDGWRWRVGLLRDGLWRSLWAGIQSVRSLDLHGTQIPVRLSDFDARYKSYDDLLNDAEGAHYLRMAFVSPTTFRQGRLDLPLPEPGAVFHSWLSRWNDFAPPHRRMAEGLLDVVREHVAIAGIERMHTRRHDLGRASPVGFVGHVTFVITRAGRLTRADRRRLNALADYAEFCGTGRKTTQGMGQTRRAPRD